MSHYVSDATELRAALANVIGALVGCRQMIMEDEKATLPEEVAKHARSKSWKAAEALAKGQGDGVAVEASAAIGNSMVGMFSALINHIQDLEIERARSKEDLESAIASMQKWRAREELQREKVKEMKQQLVEEVGPIASLESQVDRLERELKLSQAQTEHALKLAASHQLRSSRCASMVSCEDLLEQTLCESPRGRFDSLHSSRNTSIASQAECNQQRPLDRKLTEDDTYSEQSTPKKNHVALGAVPPQFGTFQVGAFHSSSIDGEDIVEEEKGGDQHFQATRARNAEDKFAGKELEIKGVGKNIPVHHQRSASMSSFESSRSESASITSAINFELHEEERGEYRLELSAPALEKATLDNSQAPEYNVSAAVQKRMQRIYQAIGSPFSSPSPPERTNGFSLSS